MGFETDIVAHLDEAPVVQIRKGVGRIIDRSGRARIERTMSIQDMRVYYERVGRALERHAAGEQDVIVDD